MPSRVIGLAPGLALAMLPTPAPARVDWIMASMCGSARAVPIPVRTNDKPRDDRDGQCAPGCHALTERRRKPAPDLP